MGSNVVSETHDKNGRDDECGNHFGGFLKKKDAARSIGQTANNATISAVDKGLCPDAPTVAPMKAALAIVSMNLAKPSACSLVNFNFSCLRFFLPLDRIRAKVRTMPAQRRTGTLREFAEKLKTWPSPCFLVF